jgi:hypothetical protein
MKVKHFYIAHLISFVFFQIFILLYFWEGVPNTLYFHSDINGVKRNEMSKLFLFLFPLINGLLLLLLLYISNKPEQWNLPKPSTESFKTIPKILLILAYIVSAMITYSVLTSLFPHGILRFNIFSTLFIILYFTLPYLIFTLSKMYKS